MDNPDTTQLRQRPLANQQRSVLVSSLKSDVLFVSLHAHAVVFFQVHYGALGGYPNKSHLRLRAASILMRSYAGTYANEHGSEHMRMCMATEACLKLTSSISACIIPAPCILASVSLNIACEGW